jgi:hypothetical protein
MKRPRFPGASLSDEQGLYRVLTQPETALDHSYW